MLSKVKWQRVGVLGLTYTFVQCASIQGLDQLLCAFQCTILHHIKHSWGALHNCGIFIYDWKIVALSNSVMYPLHHKEYTALQQFLTFFQLPPASGKKHLSSRTRYLGAAVTQDGKLWVGPTDEEFARHVLSLLADLLEMPEDRNSMKLRASPRIALRSGPARVPVTVTCLFQFSPTKLAKVTVLRAFLRE